MSNCYLCCGLKGNLSTTGKNTLILTNKHENKILEISDPRRLHQKIYRLLTMHRPITLYTCNHLN